MAIDTLLPKKLDEAEDAYKSVLELNEVLLYAEKGSVKNIALTGPYGSGKSSVLVTLRKDFSKGRNYLPISLATLQANDEEMCCHQDEKSKKTRSAYEDEDATKQESTQKDKVHEDPIDNLR